MTRAARKPCAEDGRQWWIDPATGVPSTGPPRPPRLSGRPIPVQWQPPEQRRMILDREVSRPAMTTTTPPRPAPGAGSVPREGPADHDRDTGAGDDSSVSAAQNL